MANQAADGKILWRKVSGTLTLKDKTKVGPGETFMARPEDIPAVFRNNTVPVNPDDLPKPGQVSPVDPELPSYTIKSCGPNRYNVLNSQGKAVNEKPMSMADAKQLIEGLG